MTIRPQSEVLAEASNTAAEVRLIKQANNMKSAFSDWVRDAKSLHTASHTDDKARIVAMKDDIIASFQATIAGA